MIRALACLALGFPLVAQADLKSELQAKYHQFDSAIARKDLKGVGGWIRNNLTSDFTYTSKDKNRYQRAAYEKGIRDQIGITKKMTSVSSRVGSVKISGSTATVVVDSDTDAVVVFDTRPMRLVDKSHCVDTWVKVGKAWRLKKSVQTKGDTQMFQQ